MLITQQKYFNFKLMDIVTIFVLSIFGALLELNAIFNPSFKISGILGDIWYLYLYIMEIIILCISFYLYYYKNSYKYVKFYILGLLWAVLGMILNILSIIENLFLYIEPFGVNQYGSTWEIWNNISLFVVIGLLAVPLLVAREYQK